jgi:RNA polymerase sigma factor (sigma-70 family)
MNDMELIREYVDRRSEPAFEALVSRYINLVYSAAVRQVRDPHLAEEITQAVFIILSRKAADLGPATILPSWLHRTAVYAAADTLKSLRRRAKREQEAYMQSLLNEPEPDHWPSIAPVIDEALAELRERDRSAIVLRYFENKNLQEVGDALGASEDAAKKRVNRALEKLRKFLSRRGILLSAAAIAAAVSANSVQAAPIGLVGTTSAAALAQGAAAGGSTLIIVKGALKLMAWTKTKIALLTGTGLLVAAGTATFAIAQLEEHPPAAAPVDGPVFMKIYWDTGKHYAMNISMDQGTETQVPGLAQPVSEKVQLDQKFLISPVKQFNEGGWQLEFKFENQTMNASRAGQTTLIFDSAQEPAGDTNSLLAPVLRAMIGSTIQYYTDASGKVTRMEGVDDLRNRIAASADPQAQALLGSMFSEDTLRQYGSLADSLPGRTVLVGDSWRVQKDVRSPIGLLALDLKYTFKNWEQHGDRRCARVEFSGRVSTKDTGAAAASGMQVEITKGTVSGEFWYDPDLSMTVDSDNQQNLSLKIVMRQGEMPSQFTRKMRVTLAPQ